MKLIISGSKTVQSWDLTLQAITSSTFDLTGVTQVFTDMRPGPSIFAFRWALTQKIPVRQWKPDWAKLGKPAQLILCFEMAAFADGLIALTDGTDHVAEYQIKIAKSCGLRVHVVRVERQQQTLADYGREQTTQGNRTVVAS